MDDAEARSLKLDDLVTVTGRFRHRTDPGTGNLQLTLWVDDPKSRDGWRQITVGAHACERKAGEGPD
jgi:hypothetical protein